MYIWFLIFALGAIAAIPIHFLSVEHIRFQERYGKVKGTKICERYGRLSADLLFFSLIGIWFSPQPRFIVPVLQNSSASVPVVNFPIPLINLIVSVPFVFLGAWLLVNSVKGLSRKVSETHKPEKVITSGVYTVVRHPQHLGWSLTHIGFSFLLSASYSLFFTPLMIGLLYLVSKKEEKELIREFGTEYEEYQKKVPMLLPR